jgi:hypothetical protein
MTLRPFLWKGFPLLLTLLAVNLPAAGETTRTNIDVTALANGWVGTTGNYSCSLGTIPERYQSYEWTGSVAANTLTNLPNGNYEVEVYCSASEAWKSTAGITDDNRSTFTELSVNDVSVAVPAYTTNSVTTPTLYTLNATVTDGTMSIALRNRVAGPNWFIMQLNKVTLVTPAEETYPNTTVPECVTVNGKRYLTGKNLIENGSFEGNPMLNWTSGTGAALLPTYFRYGNGCLTARTNQETAAAGSIKQAWAIEKGKTYIFSYKVRDSKKTGVGASYQVLSLTNSATTENTNAVLLGSNNATNGNATITTDGTWSTNTVAFTNDEGYAYALFSARWLASSASFDDFYLVEAEEVTDNAATLLARMQAEEAAAERTAPNTETAATYGTALTEEQGNAALQLLAANGILSADLSQLTAQGVTLRNPQANANLMVKDASIDVEPAIHADNGTLRAGALLTDRAPLGNPTVLQGTIAYSRTLTNEYGTLLLPFAVSGTEQTRFYQLRSAQEDVLYFEELASVPANTPVMFHTTQAELILTGDGLSATTPQVTDDFFTGTYRTLSAVPQGSYVISNGQYWSVDSQVSLAPFRAYLHTLPTGASAGERLSIDVSYTGIVSTPVDNGKALRIFGEKGRLRVVAGTQGNTLRLYNLGGQLLQSTTLAAQEETVLTLPAGVYILNGTKTVVY